MPRGRVGVVVVNAGDTLVVSIRLQLAPSGWRPGMFIRILQCPELPLQQRLWAPTGQEGPCWEVPCLSEQKQVNLQIQLTPWGGTDDNTIATGTQTQ